METGADVKRLDLLEPLLSLTVGAAENLVEARDDLPDLLVAAIDLSGLFSLSWRASSRISSAYKVSLILSN